MAKVSVLVAAWQAQATLAAALDSVLQQTEPDWELFLIADDGVDYRAHLPEVVVADSRMVFLSSGGVATGPSRARNVGLAQASGSHVAVLDADDLFAPRRLEVLLGTAERHGLASDCVRVTDASGRVLRHAFPPGSPDRHITAEDIMACGVPLNPLIRRDLIETGWPDIPFAEDVVVNLQLLDRAGCFPVVMQPLYNYVTHPASICHGPDAAVTADRGYGAILAELEAGGFGLSGEMRLTARQGFLEKQANNQAYARALEKDDTLSFQAFMARGS